MRARARYHTRYIQSVHIKAKLDVRKTTTTTTVRWLTASRVTFLGATSRLVPRWGGRASGAPTPKCSEGSLLRMASACAPWALIRLIEGPAIGAGYSTRHETKRTRDGLREGLWPRTCSIAACDFRI